jgi:hypothetical protein
MPKHPNCNFTCEALLNAGLAGQHCPTCLALGVECLGGEHPSQVQIAASAGKFILINYFIFYMIL